MNRFKIIIGALLLWGSAREYVSAGMQLGNLHSPFTIIFMLLLIILFAWLIGSGFSKKKIKIRSIEFLRYYIFSVIAFIVLVFISIASLSIPKDFVQINGVKIPLSKCIDFNFRIIPNEVDRKEYCHCAFEKITSQDDLKSRYRKQLENGDMDKIYKDLQSTNKFYELGISDCMTSINMKWTETVANSMKKSWIKQLKQTEFGDTINIDTYCDCLIKEYKKYPLNKIKSNEFQESKLSDSIYTDCIMKNKK
ncbi:hypothetical protein [uncultured Aquimarina sp.]|uniref:hypothetical protein n=1 Tax=uncultured Aquimarina sp. TaxID=575652 RepID=UPI002627D26B|nr:hypothetical protein [uncultured Aquimarina sp.]